MFARCLPGTLLVCVLMSSPMPLAQGERLGFEETFALSTDRAATLDQLIPGTPAFYLYRCLLLQHEESYDQVPAVLAQWAQRHGRTPELLEIEHRQKLLAFDLDPSETYRYLREALLVRLNHQPQLPGVVPDLPTAFDSRLIDWDVLAQQALQQDSSSLRGFERRALPRLIDRKLNNDQVMDLLKRIETPDHEGLVQLISENLKTKNSSGFGSLAIHNFLMLEQLDACAQKQPNLLGLKKFVDEYVSRLQPASGVDWRHDAAQREAYFDRLEDFARRLPESQSALLANVLYHRLVHDHALGLHDSKRFLDYLAIPRQSDWRLPARANRARSSDGISVPGLPPVADDQPLIRAYLEQDFRTAKGFERFEPYLRTEVLQRIFAETKILYGLGDMQQWYAMLNDPAGYEALKNRVEIEFAPTQPALFPVDAAVSLDVDLKNVGTLLVKVFEIDPFNVYVETGKEIDVSLDLDGVVAHEEFSVSLDESPLQRVRRRFDFPSLTSAGIWVVELVGNGISSRAVIRKGKLRASQRESAAGHVFRVYDEEGTPLPGASIWFGGRDYVAHANGEIVLPYSTEPGEKQIILRHGERASLDELDHAEESYALELQAWLDRESLLPGDTAHLMVRVHLSLNERPVSLSLLESPVLKLMATESDGVITTSEVVDLELTENAELIHAFRVPDRLVSLTVSMNGSVQSLSLGEDVELNASDSAFQLNGILRTEEISAFMLSRVPGGYVLEARGRSGEGLADQVVRLRLKHEDFVDPVDVQLKTDEQGSIDLGPLDDILAVTLVNAPGAHHTWELVPERRSRPSELRALEGTTIRVPYDGEASEITRSVVSLLELRGNDYSYRSDDYAYDRSSHVSLKGRFLEIEGLPVGDYDLRVEDSHTPVTVPIAIHVAPGVAHDGWAVSRDQIAPLNQVSSLQVAGLSVEDDVLLVRLDNARSDARVHVVGTRSLPVYNPFGWMHTPASREEAIVWSTAPDSDYHAGLEISDEARYILERRYATTFPGNMLRRPSLLLNPWEVRESETLVGMGGGAAASYGKGTGRGIRASKGGLLTWDRTQIAPNPGEFPNLAYLPRPSILLANLRPDASGVVRVPLADLGAGRLLHVLALDAESTIYQSLALEQSELVPRDVRLEHALPSADHVAVQRTLQVVPEGSSVVIDDVSTAKFELYDSLASVFRLYATLDETDELDAWRFLLDWPRWSRSEKLEFYNDFGSHEMHVFLHQKDPDFFKEIVLPYLENKSSKTFLDEWLLERDLTAYLEPFAYSQLNVMERILLGKRMPGQSQAVMRQIVEELDLMTPDIALQRQLFEAALLGSAMDVAQESLPGPKSRGPRGPGAESMVDDAFEAEFAVDEETAAQLRSLGYDAGLASDAAMRVLGKSLYRGTGATKSYVEDNYWHLRIWEQGAALITPTAFWLDFARAGDDKAFLSKHFALATRHVNEMLLALALLDLPFEASDHTTNGTWAFPGRLTITTASHALLVCRELRVAERDEAGGPLLVEQKVFRADERYRYEGNRRYESYVDGELLTHVVYGSQVVISNPTSQPRSLELLLQIPEGAIPVANGLKTAGLDISLPALGSVMREVFFYFPRIGDFPMYPAHVSSEGRFLVAGKSQTFHVVSEPSSVDESSWGYVSQRGTLEGVLAYIAKSNPGRLDLERIAWRMADKTAFQQVLQALRERHVFDRSLWAYALMHADAQATGELLQMDSAFLAQCGPVLESPLVTINPVQRRLYEHVEFAPLVNERVHSFGGERRILNEAFAAQYQSFLEITARRPQLNANDWLEVTYYLLLQDRVEEALAAFGRVPRDAIEARMQHDYAAAYLDFFTPDHALARGLAEPYRDYPVPRWRDRFLDVLNQLDEAEGAAVVVVDPESRMQSDAELAAQEPLLELEVADGRVTIWHDNLGECEIGYYLMDIEFLFSARPFSQAEGDIFAFIQPNQSDALVFDSGSRETSLELPESFRNKNVLVEVRGGGVVRREEVFANSMLVQMMENYGQLKVADVTNGQPLPEVYIKVYARTRSGRTRFHKDGYTDLRGRFDYVSHSGEELAPAEAYSVLVASKEHGAAIREVDPPVR